jgi:hypothetical protein
MNDTTIVACLMCGYPRFLLEDGYADSRVAPERFPRDGEAENSCSHHNEIR